MMNWHWAEEIMSLEIVPLISGPMGRTTLLFSFTGNVKALINGLYFWVGLLQLMSLIKWNIVTQDIKDSLSSIINLDFTCESTAVSSATCPVHAVSVPWLWAVHCVYHLLCSLQQGRAEHTTNLCHYSVIASNHMISFMGQWRRPAWCSRWLLRSLGNGPVALWWRVVCCPPCRAKDAPSLSLPEMASGWNVFFTARPFHLHWCTTPQFPLRENIAHW